MNYLKQNLHNSITLNYDIMKLIYEYADPLVQIRFQIENKDYDLNDINSFENCIIFNGDGSYRIVYQEIIYKICGLIPYYGIGHYRTYMIRDLNQVNPHKNYKNRSIKQLYQLWKKL